MDIGTTEGRGATVAADSERAVAELNACGCHRRVLGIDPIRWTACAACACAGVAADSAVAASRSAIGIACATLYAQ